MTEYINENDFCAELELDPNFRASIAEVFAETVEAQVDARLELIADLINTAETFAAFVNENEITESELDEAFSFFCEHFGIDEEDAEMLAEYIWETFLVEEEADDNELGEEIIVDENARRVGPGTAKHLGSFTLADSNVAHCWDRGKAYHTNHRYIIKKHSPTGLHLATHTAGTKAELDATLATINGKKPVKEGAGDLMMESVINVMKRAAGQYE